MNMTPMIDVVFQLIIFFVVTLKMSKEINKEILLEDGKNGEIITADSMPVQTLTIEVDRRNTIAKWFRKKGQDEFKCRVSINNAVLNKKQLGSIISQRYKKFGSFPVLIRADRDAVHEDVKQVMDICTARGVWKVGFVAIQDQKDKDTKAMKQRRGVK